MSFAFTTGQVKLLIGREKTLLYWAMMVLGLFIL
jgi:hypothetical protein